MDKDGGAETSGNELERYGYAASGFGEAASRDRIWRAPPIGELAVETGLVGREAMQSLLALQRRWGTRLGDIMVSTGDARPTDVARLVGRQSGVRCVDLKLEPADPTLAHADALDFYISERCIPWQWSKREVVYVAADPERARSAIAELEGRPCPVLVASTQDIDKALRTRFRQTLDERARFDLSKTFPESSASHRLMPAQLWWLLVASTLMLLAYWRAPGGTVFALNLFLGICFLSIGALRGLSIFVGLIAPPTDDELAFERNTQGPDAELPVYTVLVPLFREAEVLPILADALKRLDYPASKLDVKLVFEETDNETYNAAKALKLPGNFEYIRVPHSLPLTKPKACNYALPFARGEFLVVYDAEDLPEPDQLRRAVAAFRLGDEKLACVQAQLNYYNWFENWLTRQFALEYASYFDLLLPMLAKFGLPIPLGGTSTHFRTRLLRQVGAWDPFNVTEDADLGMRFAVLGLRTGIIRSTTHEEANCRFDNWLRQRSRWVKGWMQTYLVRMRHPIELYRALGFRRFLGFQLVIGGSSLSSLVHPLFYLSAMRVLTDPLPLDGTGHRAMILFFDIFVLVVGYGITVTAGMAAATMRGLKPLVLQALMMPLYWLLISAGAYKELFQLVRRPFHWEKTVHGISRLTAGQLARVRLARDPIRETIATRDC
jgi:cellulose synthase/poly-beta-1,6-N-acetylglucosamine synthase-like glycosyltransferase